MLNDRIDRRGFVKTTGLAALAMARPAATRGVAASPEASRRRFFTVLSLARIGHKASFTESVDLAVKHGFEGVDPDAGYFARLSDDELRKLLDDLKSKKIRLGASGLPVEFRADDAAFNDGLEKLPAVSKALERAGVTRVCTWILPFSDELTYLQNFRQHAYRLRSCAQILADHGQRLGLEYVGPRTAWRSKRHPFVHTLSETKELIVAIGTGNVGVQLDSYHWFNAEETQEDLLTLRNDDIVTVDLNDAPAGLAIDQYMDLARELPGATGVIPIRSFIDALKKIDYDGPVHAEPFNAALRAQPLDEACAATAAAIKKVL